MLWGEINGVWLKEGDYSADGEVILWCDACLGWTMGLIDVPTGELIQECCWCAGEYHILDAINDFVVVGNIFAHGINVPSK